MEQISLPYRIALAALLVVAALWFTVLKPKPAEESAAPTAPGAAGLSRATDRAKGAVAASKASAARSEAAAGQAPKAASTSAARRETAVAVKRRRVAARKTAPGAATKPSPTLVKADGGKDPSAPLLAELDRGRTLVLLFWNKKGSDDRAVRTAIKGIGRHKGKVVVKAIPSGQVGDYEAITRGAQVLQSPTLLVIGKDKKARSIVGFTYKGEIEQLVGDVLAGRAS